MFFILILLSSIISISFPKPKLIYIGDPMCSWCYGIAPELNKVVTHFGEALELEIIMGGLRPYNKETMVELKEFLTDHWGEVEKASGQQFKYDILSDSSITYDTEPPSRAIVVVRSIVPEKEYDFFKRVQEAFYFHNKNMHLVNSYNDILDDLKIDVHTFRKSFESDEMKIRVRKDFERAAEMGVRGFPTLILVNGTDKKLIANGYKKGEAMILEIEKWLDKER